MLHTETDALGGVTTYSYNQNDMVASILDPEGYRTYYSYDEEDRVSTIRDANGNLTRYEYDGNGNLVKVTNPRDTGTVLLSQTKGRTLRKRVSVDGKFQTGVSSFTSLFPTRSTQALSKTG